MTDPKTKDAGMKIKLSWGSLKDIPTIHSDQLLLSFLNNDFYLVFGEMELLGIINQEDPPKEATIKPVAKIAINPKNMLIFEELIHKQLEEYRKALKGKE